MVTFKVGLSSIEVENETKNIKTTGMKVTDDHKIDINRQCELNKLRGESSKQLAACILSRTRCHIRTQYIVFIQSR